MLLGPFCVLQMSRQLCVQQAKDFFDQFEIPHKQGWYNTTQSLKITLNEQSLKYQRFVLDLKAGVEEISISLGMKDIPYGQVLFKIFLFQSIYFYTEAEMHDETNTKSFLRTFENYCKNTEWEQDMETIVCYDNLQPIKFPELKSFFFHAFRQLQHDTQNHAKYNISFPVLKDPNDKLGDWEQKNEVPMEDESKHELVTIQDWVDKLEKPCTPQEEKDSIFTRIFHSAINGMGKDWKQFLQNDIQFLMNAVFTVQITIRCKQIYDQERTKKTFTIGRRLDLTLIEIHPDIVEIHPDIVDKNDILAKLDYPKSFLTSRKKESLMRCKILFNQLVYQVCLNCSTIYCLFGNEEKHQKMILSLIESSK